MRGRDVLAWDSLLFGERAANFANPVVVTRLGLSILFCVDYLEGDVIGEPNILLF